MHLVVANAVRRILVVEDDPDLRGALIEALVEVGYAPVGATDVRDARARLTHGFDLVLLDLHLPGAPAEDLLAELRRANARVVLTSADATERSRAVAKRWAVPFVLKPFDLDHLLSTVAESLPDGA